MSILSLNKEGIWFLDYELEPVEFWPYTTIVTDVVFTGPREQFDDLNKELVRMFKEQGIEAYIENKCAFGVKDHRGSMWYLGFKDFRFDLGMSVRPDQGKQPVRKSGTLAQLEALYLPTSPNSSVVVPYDGHEFDIKVTGETGINTGRPRYWVDCRTCKVNLHSGTTGPKEQIKFHLKEMGKKNG